MECLTLECQVTKQILQYVMVHCFPPCKVYKEQHLSQHRFFSMVSHICPKSLTEKKLVSQMNEPGSYKGGTPNMGPSSAYCLAICEEMILHAKGTYDSA